MVKNTVLIPIDGSHFSLQILNYVTRFLAPADNELILLHVAEEPHVVEVEEPGARREPPPQHQGIRGRIA
mgnify:CR=1 FL=1